MDQKAGAQEAGEGERGLSDGTESGQSALKIGEAVRGFQQAASGETDEINMGVEVV
jgi:hypothetical protein